MVLYYIFTIEYTTYFCSKFQVLHIEDNKSEKLCFLGYNKHKKENKLKYA